MVLDLFTVAVLGFFGARLVKVARRSVASHTRAHVTFIARGLRWRHFLPVPLVLTAVLTVAVAAIQVPGLDWGWWTAIGGVGNPVTGGTDRTAGTVLEWLIPLVFLTLLVPGLPLFAEAEERMFRFGAENWSVGHRIRRVMQFGLIHAVVGIPIGVALALSVGGAYFMSCYLRRFRRTHDPDAAMLESTRAHLGYNTVILGVVLIAVIADALVS